MAKMKSKNMKRVYSYLSATSTRLQLMGNEGVTFRDVAIACSIPERTAREQIRNLRLAGAVKEGPRIRTIGGRSARTWRIGEDVAFIKAERQKTKETVPDSVSEQLLAENSALKKENRKLIKKVEKLEQEKAQLGVASFGGAKVDEKPRQLSFGSK